mmetsp:Transcript_4572/g.8236  ORF Transcript_4572/g.8236 Transcript_4572/m.8236 type:complete len:93 (+) Transcript_4572:1825-2103(+)
MKAKGLWVVSDDSAVKQEPLLVADQEVCTEEEHDVVCMSPGQPLLVPPWGLGCKAGAPTDLGSDVISTGLCLETRGTGNALGSGTRKGDTSG